MQQLQLQTQRLQQQLAGCRSQWSQKVSGITARHSVRMDGSKSLTDFADSRPLVSGSLRTRMRSFRKSPSMMKATVLSLLFFCFHSVSTLFPLCFHSVSTLFPLCFHSVSTLFPLSHDLPPGERASLGSRLHPDNCNPCIFWFKDKARNFMCELCSLLMTWTVAAWL